LELVLRVSDWKIQINTQLLGKIILLKIIGLGKKSSDLKRRIDL
jgi:hypothetical protein